MKWLSSFKDIVTGIIDILFSCARERKTTTVYSENQSADQRSSISDFLCESVKKTTANCV